MTFPFRLEPNYWQSGTLICFQDASVSNDLHLYQLVALVHALVDYTHTFYRDQLICSVFYSKDKQAPGLLLFSWHLLTTYIQTTRRQWGHHYHSLSDRTIWLECNVQQDWGHYLTFSDKKCQKHCPKPDSGFTVFWVSLNQLKQENHHDQINKYELSEFNHWELSQTRYAQCRKSSMHQPSLSITNFCQQLTIPSVKCANLCMS